MPAQPVSQARFLVAGVLTFAALVGASALAQRSFGTGFLPHGYCFTWVPGLLWLNVISDSLIAAAYLSIPITLLYFVQRRGDLPFSWVFLLFGVFIVACGMTHALDVWTIWNADYWLSAGVKAVTAAASVPTAAALVWLVPKALAIPSAQQLRQANEALRLEVEARKLAEQRLEASSAELSRMVDERTQDLRKASALLDAFFESSPLGLAVFDSKLRYVRLNGTLAAIDRLPVESHWGRTVEEVDPEVDPRVREALVQIRDRRSRVVRIDVAGHARGSEPVRQWRMTFHDVPKTAGDPLIGLSCEDITDRAQAKGGTASA